MEEDDIILKPYRRLVIIFFIGAIVFLFVYPILPLGRLLFVLLIVMALLVKSQRFAAFLVQRKRQTAHENIMSTGERLLGKDFVERLEEGQKNWVKVPDAQMPEEAFAEWIAHEGLPSVYLHRTVRTEEKQINSFLGGLPKLPVGIAWPTNKDGFALHHLAQIDLAEMPRIHSSIQLPTKGMLWFFADIDSKMTWDRGPESSHSRVIYHSESTASLRHHDAPDNLPDIKHKPGDIGIELRSQHDTALRVYREKMIEGHQISTWSTRDEMPSDFAYNFPYIKQRSDRMMKEVADFTAATLATREPNRFLWHFLLGAYDGRMNSTGGYGIRLAQFASDSDVGFMFCDCGVIDFSISAEDLDAGLWDRAWAGTAGG